MFQKCPVFATNEDIITVSQLNTKISQHLSVLEDKLEHHILEHNEDKLDIIRNPFSQLKKS